MVGVGASCASVCCPCGRHVRVCGTVATAPPPAEALHPEFGEKKSKSSKGKATEASPAPVTVSVPAAPSPIPDEPSSASKKSVRFDASVSDPVKDASSISLAKSDESEADAEARSASLQAPEYEAHLPRFRFYENDFPEQDEFVVVKVGRAQRLVCVWPCYPTVRLCHTGARD